MTENPPTLMRPDQLRQLDVHPLAQRFRSMDEDERVLLLESLARGYDPRYPIILDAGTGTIVDGRHRRTAACALGLAAPVVAWHFPDDAAIAEFVRAANVARRHLTAEERRKQAARLINGSGMTVREAAKLAGVSPATAQRAAAQERVAVSDETEPALRVNGADGETDPATRPQRCKVTEPTPVRLAATVKRALRAAGAAHAEAVQLRDAGPLIVEPELREVVERLAVEVAQLQLVLPVAELEPALAVSVA